MYTDCSKHAVSPSPCTYVHTYLYVDAKMSTYNLQSQHVCVCVCIYMRKAQPKRLKYFSFGIWCARECAYSTAMIWCSIRKNIERQRLQHIHAKKGASERAQQRNNMRAREPLPYIFLYNIRTNFAYLFYIFLHIHELCTIWVVWGHKWLFAFWICVSFASPKKLRYDALLLLLLLLLIIIIISRHKHTYTDVE